MRKGKFGFLLLLGLVTGFSASSQTVPTLGMVAAIEEDSLLYASGFRLIGESVQKMLSPTLTKAQFRTNVKKIKHTRCKVYLCNILFPGSLKIAGPAVDEKQVLAYASQVFANAKKAGIPLLVLGSGGSRRLPDGYDYPTAVNDFVTLCGKLAVIARKYGITIAIESLNRAETNFLNTLPEVADVVRKVNYPNFRLNADLYHMSKENEPPQHLVDAGPLIVYVELAEKEQRSLPGVMGDDFKPYFRALKSIGYQGPLVLEARSSNLRKEVPLAYAYVRKQLQEVLMESR